MIKFNYDIKSRELKNFLDFEMGDNKLFFKSISKIASLYNLTSQGHKYARFELYRIISKLDKLRITYQKDIENDYIFSWL